MKENQQEVIKYYTNWESKLGFDHILWGSKHFGYYPNKKADISEKEAQTLLQDLVAEKLNLKAKQSVLDAGCGQGVVSTYLAHKYNVNVSGITIVPFEVQKARERAQELGVHNQTSYQVMDYSKTAFASNYFDAIYTTETLSHSPDINKTLKEFFRILKPGGKFAFFEYTLAPDDKFSESEKKILDLIIKGSAMMGLKDFRHDEFPKVLRQTGFENVKEKDISKNTAPSLYRLYKLAALPYSIIKIFKLQKFFVNTTAGYECYKMAKKDLIRYCIFTGQKPAS